MGHLINLMKIISRLLAVSMTAIVVTATAKGAYTLYTDAPAFLSAVSTRNPGSLSLSGIPSGAFANTSFSDNGYTMTASSSSGLYGETFIQNPAIRFLSVGGAAADELVMTFSVNVYAVGGWFFSAEAGINPGSFVATVVDSDGNIDSFSNPTTNYADSFLGWIYDNPITSLTLSTDPQNLGFPTAADQIIVAVPEPSACVLLGLAVACCIIRRRRA